MCHSLISDAVEMSHTFNIALSHYPSLESRIVVTAGSTQYLLLGTAIWPGIMHIQRGAEPDLTPPSRIHSHLVLNHNLSSDTFGPAFTNDWAGNQVCVQLCVCLPLFYLFEVTTCVQWWWRPPEQTPHPSLQGVPLGWTNICFCHSHTENACVYCISSHSSSPLRPVISVRV